MGERAIAMAKNKIVRAWVQQQASDIYVKQAHAAGYRSRAAYKLLALASKYTLFQTATTIIDLGCAPGSWLQVISKLAKPQAIIIAVLFRVIFVCHLSCRRSLRTVIINR
jgi:23S rRNA (uridine2552-2'-O)-methyltransferase